MTRRVVYLMRGLPSSGKSHTAPRLAGDTGIVIETDAYFRTEVGDDPNRNDYDKSLLDAARRQAFERPEAAQQPAPARPAAARRVPRPGTRRSHNTKIHASHQFQPLRCYRTIIVIGANLQSRVRTGFRHRQGLGAHRLFRARRPWTATRTHWGSLPHARAVERMTFRLSRH